LPYKFNAYNFEFDLGQIKNILLPTVQSQFCRQEYEKKLYT